MNKDELLLQLHTQFDQESQCVLKKTATQAVFGNGNPEAKIVFIGEAPGKSEDLAGKPFIGRSGKFLDELLESINMKRKDVYITNIVKYRPPKNRDPDHQEKKDCAEWLYAELNFIKPDIIIFLGRHSMIHFLPELKISEAHGKLVHREIPNITTNLFFPLYHPAAALYNGGMRTTLLEDFGKIPSVLKKIKEKKSA